MHSRDGSDIARSEIELKKTIFMNDLEKSALLFIFVDGSLLLKWKFYEVLINRADGSVLFSIWQVFPEPFSWTTRFSLKQTKNKTKYKKKQKNKINGNTKQTKHRLHPSDSVVIASYIIISVAQ